MQGAVAGVILNVGRDVDIRVAGDRSPRLLRCDERRDLRRRSPPPLFAGLRTIELAQVEAAVVTAPRSVKSGSLNPTENCAPYRYCGGHAKPPAYISTTASVELLAFGIR
jgi:hypothetical protein